MAINKDQRNQLIKEMIRTAAVYLAFLLGLLLIAWILSLVTNITYALSLPIYLGICGTFLALLGTNYVADATSRYDARDTSLWKVGNFLQSLGFVLTLFALIIK